MSLTTGEYLFRAGDRSGSGFLIEEGSIEIRTSRSGRNGGPPHEVVLARLGPGELVGEMSAADGTLHSVDAVAATDAVLLTIDSEQIRDRLAGADPILRMVLEGQVKRTRAMLAMLRGSAYGQEPALPPEAGADEDGLSKFRLEGQLREALQQHRLEVRYQPVLEIASGRIAGYEALVRWEHPTRGPVSPDEFIKLAEETSLIVPVGEYVFDAACAALDQLRGDDMPFVAVNVSARQLASPGLIRGVVERRDALRLPPGCIKVEITESQALDYQQVADVIDHCHADAIGVSLDDFGTGYSHLTNLHLLDFDTIKIDQAFVRGMFSSERAMSIVRAIVAMGQAIGADLVVEGVETREQLEFLGSIGCRYAQGFLIGHAEPLETVLASRWAPRQEHSPATPVEAKTSLPQIADNPRRRRALAHVPAMDTPIDTPSLHARFIALRESLSTAVIGQAALVERLLIALLADGHLLVEGAPGLAKTTAIKELAARIEGDFSRVQFTPDLLPADLTGTDIWRTVDARFEFQPGPLFHNLLLADEVNRAPPKVQSALLEAMGERQITVGLSTYALPRLFLVMATQNPIEQEGTYALPEAQLDRFLMHVRVGYPEAGAESAILRLVRERERNTLREERSPPAVMLGQSELFDARTAVLDLHLAPALERYLIEIVLASRDAGRYDPALATKIAWGASPRGSIALERCARARAWLAGRDYVTPEDVQAVAPDVLRHRLLPSYEAIAEGWDGDKLARAVLDRVPLP